MLRTVLAADADRDARIAALCARSAAADPEAERAVRPILDDVRARGDAAVLDWSERLDGARPAAIELDALARRRAAAQVAPDVRQALERAAARIRAFHERERPPQSFEYQEDGVRLGLRVEPLARVGVYAPGGTARYPSTVLMTAVPARVAGVPEVVLCTPAPSPETLAAAEIAGVARVFAIGGAQAIAALAFGTATVPRVDKIVGPGNRYVTAAKRLVYGEVAVEGIAGPSEVLVIADERADPRHVAADLLAQAEHDPDARPILLTTSAVLASAVDAELERQIADLPRRAIAEAALGRSAAVVVASPDEALALARRIAPEHLELHVADARALAGRARCAGAIFVGGFTPEAAGDYLAGPSHVLPTGGAARFAGPLGVHDFLRRTSIVEYTRAGLAAQAADIARLAKVEGLHAHARAVAARLDDPE